MEFFEYFPPRWLARIGLKFFAVNIRDDLEPNMWCYCPDSLDHEVIVAENQQVSFLIKNQDSLFGLSDLYASTNHVIRRSLW